MVEDRARMRLLEGKVEELPKTGVGKYDKRRLRDEHADRLARSAPASG